MGLRWEQREDRLRLVSDRTLLTSMAPGLTNTQLQPYANPSPQQQLPSLAQPFTFSGHNVFHSPSFGITL
ncbi:uncharacterized protein EKO05_0003269 [Ascochyta rabiei]|uniref:uncharacterized protein n=1 Tax=Didymella rabiei TaxID=5454 RepID=UPI0022074222|nr:uncharacterized protein EKO05_0003269 [Ascochyta rabiei]UPX12730.1 hypothetical protein EKO05_0003269 [Ascochyta rabiei]